MTRKRNNNKSSNQRNPSNYDAYKGTDRVTRSQTSSPSQANDNSATSTGNNKGKQPPAKHVHLDNSQQSTSKGSNSASLTSRQLDEQEVAKTYGQANASAPPPQDVSQRVLQLPPEEACDQEIEMQESEQGTNENPPVDRTPIVPLTRLYAAVPFEKVKGKSLKAKIETMNKIFMSILLIEVVHSVNLKKLNTLPPNLQIKMIWIKLVPWRSWLLPMKSQTRKSNCRSGSKSSPLYLLIQLLYLTHVPFK
jgi:hypothetical protein